MIDTFVLQIHGHSTDAMIANFPADQSPSVCLRFGQNAANLF